MSKPGTESADEARRARVARILAEARRAAELYGYPYRCRRCKPVGRFSTLAIKALHDEILHSGPRRIGRFGRRRWQA
jgi:hypothetical protein